MQITLGQQYNVGEKPTVILYIYIVYHRDIRSLPSLHEVMTMRIDYSINTGLNSKYIPGTD